MPRTQWEETKFLCILPNPRAQSWRRAELEGAGQKEDGKREDLLYHCW